MGLLDRWRGDPSPDPEQVVARLREAWRGLPDVEVEEVDYRDERYHQGALHAVLLVRDAAAFGAALRVSHDVLRELLGGRVDGVGWDVVGRAPGGSTATPADVGLPARPTGAELARWRADGDTPGPAADGEVKS